MGNKEKIEKLAASIVAKRKAKEVPAHYRGTSLIKNIEMIWWTGLAPWGFEFPFPGSLISAFLVTPVTPVLQALSQSDYQGSSHHN